MPRSINNAYLLDTANGAGDKNSRPFWWPGGDGELHVHGDLGGAGAVAILHEGGPVLNSAERAVGTNYKPQGATVAVDNGANLFRAAEGWMYVELQNTSGTDNCRVWVSRHPSGERATAYLDDDNESPVT